MWDALKDLIFNILLFFYNILGDWGLAIIVVTIIVRIILAPLMQKQIKSSYHMQKMSPLMTEIKTKYAKDPARMQEEMQKIYAESKFNPLAGCLPMFLQMPIFILLFQVLHEMGDRLHGSTYEFFNLVPSLVLSPSHAIEQGVLTFIPYLILMLVFAGATFMPMILMQVGKDDAQKKQTLTMAAVMSVFMLWVSWGSPAGVLLYWGASSLIGLAQQQITLAILKKEDKIKEENDTTIKPVKVEVIRKEKKPRPTKKK